MKGFSKVFENKRLGKLIFILSKITKKVRQLKKVKAALIILNMLLFKNLGIGFAVGGSMGYIQILVFVATSSTAGALLALLAAPGGFLFVLAPIVTIIHRYESVSAETINRCRLLCEAAKQYHNNKLAIEMKSFIQEMETSVNISSEQGQFECRDEGKLYQRYKENQEYLNEQIKTFEKIKDKFSECNDETIEEISEKIEKIRQKV